MTSLLSKLFSSLLLIQKILGLRENETPNLADNSAYKKENSEREGIKRNSDRNNNTGESNQSQKKQSTLPDTLEKEIRQGRKFSLAEAIGREGGSFMKGESAIPRPLRAANTVGHFINTQLADSSSAFSTTLFNWVTSDIRLSRQLDSPLLALGQVLESLLSEPTTFYEFARQVAIAQSQLTGERPYFQQPGAPPHPDADYTHSDMKTRLSNLLQMLNSQTLNTQTRQASNHT